MSLYHYQVLHLRIAQLLCEESGIRVQDVVIAKRLPAPWRVA